MSYSNDEKAAASIEEALQVRNIGDGRIEAQVCAGWDIFGIPHGGYLAGLAGAAVLEASGKPDIFSITIHYLRKATEGPMTFIVEPVAESRRFTSLRAKAVQGDRTVLSVIASLGDRESFSGPTWIAAPAWNPREAQLTPPGVPGLPAVTERMQLRADIETFKFITGEKQDRAQLRATVEPSRVDQLAALIACDITAPAAWNVLGREGWVPTVELTAHVRARPVAGPLGIDVTTTQIQGGFLEEDALVHDAEGRLVVQSRQLACWTGA